MIAASNDNSPIEAATDVEKDIESGTGGQIEHEPEPEPEPENDSLPIKRTVTAQDWSGPDDPENPYNWPMWKRVYNSAITALLSFAVTYGSSVYTPGYAEVADKFAVSPIVALLPLSLYVLGLGFGPALGAPVSETRGRVIVYWISVPLSMLFTLGAGWSQTLAQLVICRFFAGTFSSPVLAVGSGTNVDIWPTDQRAVSVSFFLMAPFLGPVLGPFIGGFSTMSFGWRWTQWDILFVTLPVYILSLFMSESYKKIILQRRAQRLGIAPPKDNVPASKLRMFKMFFTVTMARPIHMMLTEPIVFFFSMYVSFSFAVLFAFFAAFPIVFEGIYGFNPGESGLTFLAVGIGVVLSVITGIVADRHIYNPKHREAVKRGNTMVAPEHRLYAAMLGSFGLPIGLFWFAWTAREDIHWICPVLASIPFGWGNMSIFLSAALYLIDVYGQRTGASAMAANGLMRYGLGAGFPLFTFPMYGNLGVHWATSIFAFISIGMLPIPWILYKFGPRIRARSGYDTIKA